jgi:hypothetical protein
VSESRTTCIRWKRLPQEKKAHQCEFPAAYWYRRGNDTIARCHLHNEMATGISSWDQISEDEYILLSVLLA